MQQISLTPFDGIDGEGRQDQKHETGSKLHDSVVDVKHGLGGCVAVVPFILPATPRVTYANDMQRSLVVKVRFKLSFGTHVTFVLWSVTVNI